MKTKKEIRGEAQYREFWKGMKSAEPDLRRLLAISEQKEVRLIAVCAAALVKIAMKEPQKKKMRNPTAYHLFIGAKMREGKSIQEAVALWKAR